MLKRLFLFGSLIGMLFSSTAQAAPTLQLDPPGGAISGAPGSTVGWGFTLSNTENYLVVTSAAFDTTTTLGTFTDFISAANFFVIGPAPNASTVWAQPFNATMQLGIGSFTIDPGTPWGSVAGGQIVLTYDLFSRSPMDALFNPDTDTLSNGNLLSALTSVSAVPEPETWSVMLAGVAVLGLWVRRLSTSS
jgi:hypothetical protein